MFGKAFQRKYALTDQGVKNTRAGTLWTVVVNLVVMGGMGILYLMMSRLILGGDAAVRVHGGGFAGTIQAFVPIEKTDAYVSGMNELFGEGSCYVLRIRPVGGIELR